MRRNDHAPVPGQRHGDLHVATRRQHRPGQLARQFELQRRQAAPEAKGARAAGHRAHHRVVGRTHDRPVVVQEVVDDAGQPLLRLALSVITGSPLMLPEVATSGRPNAASNS